MPNTGAVATATGCGFSCNVVFVKNSENRTCNFPRIRESMLDRFGEANKVVSDVGGTAGGFNDFLDNTRGVNVATGCNFSCRSGYVKSVSDYSCTQGQTCPIANGVGFQQTSSAPCQVVDCNTGLVKNTGENTCDIPDQGKYADRIGDEQSCDDPTGATGGFKEFLANTGAVDSATGCSFSCNAGFVKNTADSMCEIPDQGKYADNGVEKDCSPITGGSGGFDAFDVNMGAVDSATGCGFSCNASYMKDSSGRACNYPTPGTYVNILGAEVACTDITSTPNFNSWVSGAATDQDSCPFSCSASYAVSGRTCNKLIPEMLALGGDTSRILFDNGEVEAWGRVSNLPWRTHIKEDLGSHTPQALVSGYNHQCIILENAGQNHGRLMCWGSNSRGQLGVGDTNPRSTPTPVTAAFLGDDGGGTPKMVKSVAAGVEHTCALLNDDTVVCWGNNYNGQIGGGSGGTIRGTAGDPLSGGTASRIATGAYHTCAILSDNSVKCWGYNYYGQTGGGTPRLGANRTATEIATGGRFSCAILDDGSVKCWGLGSPP